jgi:hypothetical protein
MGRESRNFYSELETFVGGVGTVWMLAIKAFGKV